MPTLLIVAFALQFACAPSGLAEEPPTLAKLSFLEGVWVNDGAEASSEEHWTSANGNALLGMHKDVRQGRMSSFEFSRIDLDESGDVTYFASPGGAQPTRFRMTDLTDNRVVFENPEHDFPQRVIYWLEPDGRLGARIEGTVSGTLRKMEWSWTKRP